jgi:hypothetical protein
LKCSAFKSRNSQLPEGPEEERVYTPRAAKTRAAKRFHYSEAFGARRGAQRHGGAKKKRQPSAKRGLNISGAIKRTRGNAIGRMNKPWKISPQSLTI